MREPDLFFDLHPPALWTNPKRKFWDPSYYDWLKQNHVPIYMQEHYPEIPASIKYPFATMITEFPTGYMANTLAYMIALALMEGVTQIGIFGCNYAADSEYGPQRGSAEYWLGIAEGRGVRIALPPGCDLLGRPHLLYGYESHPDGVRHAAYNFAAAIPPSPLTQKKKAPQAHELIPADATHAPKLRDIGVPPALHVRDVFDPAALAAMRKG